MLEFPAKPLRNFSASLLSALLVPTTTPHRTALSPLCRLFSLCVFHVCCRNGFMCLIYRQFEPFYSAPPMRDSLKNVTYPCSLVVCLLRVSALDLVDSFTFTFRLNLMWTIVRIRRFFDIFLPGTRVGFEMSLLSRTVSTTPLEGLRVEIASLSHCTPILSAQITIRWPVRSVLLTKRSEGLCSKLLSV